MVANKSVIRAILGCERFEDRITPRTWTWVAGESGRWDDPASWDQNAVPDETATIWLPDGITVDMDGSDLEAALLNVGSDTLVNETVTSLHVVSLSLRAGANVVSNGLDIHANSFWLSGASIRAGVLTLDVPFVSLDTDSSIVTGSLDLYANGKYATTTILNQGRVIVHTVDGVPVSADPLTLPNAAEYAPGTMTVEGSVFAWGGLNLQQSSLVVNDDGLFHGFATVDGSLTNRGQIALTDDFYGSNLGDGIGRGLPATESVLKVTGDFTQTEMGNLTVDSDSVLARGDMPKPSAANHPMDFHGQMPLIFVSGQAVSLGGRIDLFTVHGAVDALPGRPPLKPDWAKPGYRSPLFGFSNADVTLTGRFDYQSGLVAPYSNDNVMFAICYNQPVRAIQVVTATAPRLITAATPRDSVGTPLTSGGVIQLPPGDGRQMILVANASADLVTNWARPLADALVRSSAINSNTDVVQVNWEAFATETDDSKTPDIANPKWAAWTAARQGADIGESIYDWMTQVGDTNTMYTGAKYTQFHLYSKSAGVWLVNGFTDRQDHVNHFYSDILSQSGLGLPSNSDSSDVTAAINSLMATRSYLTLFDAFVPNPNIDPATGLVLEDTLRGYYNDAPFVRWGEDPATNESIDGKSVLGLHASFAEQYVDRRKVVFGSISSTISGLILGPLMTPIAQDTIARDTELSAFAAGEVTYVPMTGEPVTSANLNIADDLPLTAAILPHAANIEVTLTDYDFVPHTVNTFDGLKTAVTGENFESSHAHGWPNSFYESALAVLDDSTPDGVTYNIAKTPPNHFTLNKNNNSTNYRAVSIVSDSISGSFINGPGSLTILTAADVPWPVPVIDPNFVTVSDQSSSNPTIQASRARTLGVPLTAVGTSTGTVELLNPDKSVKFTVQPFGTSNVEARTAAADFNRDGVPDLVAGSGPGITGRVVVLDGVTQAVLFDVIPFEASFSGGMFVAAGDLNGDGVADLIVSPDNGGGPRVTVYNGVGFGTLADFFGIDDPHFRGGVRAAVGDVNGDGHADLIVAAGVGGGPRVAIYDGSQLAPTGGPRLVGDYFAFEDTLRNGVYVAAGDLNGDGKAEVIVGAGPGGGPRVSAFKLNDLAIGDTNARVVDFFAGDPSNRGGVPVAVKDLDNDNLADVVIGGGQGSPGVMSAYLGLDLITGNATAPKYQLDITEEPNGLNVG